MIKALWSRIDATPAFIIARDIARHKVLVILALSVLISALWVVWSAHEARRLTAHWNDMLEQRDQLDIQWRNLLLEEQTLAEHNRITRRADRELQMVRPKPSEEIIVRVP